MKTVKVDLGSDIKELRIYPFFDVHIGSKKCDYKRLQADIEKARADENGYVILGGDLVNNSTKNSVGDVYSEPLTPMEQIKLAITTFEPVKDKIIGIVSGNHEARSYKADGIDLIYFLAKEFDKVECYDSTACLLFVRFGHVVGNKRGGSSSRGGRICYTLYMAHGTGQGGKLVGSKANGLHRRGDIVPNADIIVTGHTHAPITFKDAHYEINYGNSSVKLKETTFVNANSYVMHEEYAETVGMKPSANSNPVITLNGNIKYVNVNL